MNCQVHTCAGLRLGHLGCVPQYALRLVGGDPLPIPRSPSDVGVCVFLITLTASSSTGRLLRRSIISPRERRRRLLSQHPPTLSRVNRLIQADLLTAPRGSGEGAWCHHVATFWTSEANRVCFFFHQLWGVRVLASLLSQLDKPLTSISPCLPLSSGFLAATYTLHASDKHEPKKRLLLHSLTRSTFNPSPFLT
jgi:hypothetical protein